MYLKYKYGTPLVLFVACWLAFIALAVRFGWLDASLPYVLFMCLLGASALIAFRFHIVYSKANNSLEIQTIFRRHLIPVADIHSISFPQEAKWESPGSPSYQVCQISYGQPLKTASFPFRVFDTHQMKQVIKELLEAKPDIERPKTIPWDDQFL